jgi:hypothetical protein
MSNITLSNILFNVYMAGEEARTYEAREASYAIQWYVQTGRAWGEWLEALAKANPTKLVRFVSKAGGSTDDMVASASKYLRRYCGLD